MKAKRRVASKSPSPSTPRPAATIGSSRSVHCRDHPCTRSSLRTRKRTSASTSGAIQHDSGPRQRRVAQRVERAPRLGNGITAALALRWFRDRGEVSLSLLRCLPLKKGHFADTMFLPLFEETKTALRDDGLLPSESGAFVPASRGRLGRGAELRGLFPPAELAALCGKDHPVHWLLGEITVDRAPELRQYLQQQLGIEELDPESVVNRLTGGFLTQRSDAWVLRLYEFLADQSGFALRRSLRTKPVLRLDDGRHVCPPEKGQGVSPGRGEDWFLDRS